MMFDETLLIKHSNYPIAVKTDQMIVQSVIQKTSKKPKRTTAKPNPVLILYFKYSVQ